jgi:hypothetical protein
MTKQEIEFLKEYGEYYSNHVISKILNMKVNTIRVQLTEMRKAGVLKQWTFPKNLADFLKSQGITVDDLADEIVRHGTINKRELVDTLYLPQVYFANDVIRLFPDYLVYEDELEFGILDHGDRKDHSIDFARQYRAPEYQPRRAVAHIEIY